MARVPSVPRLEQPAAIERFYQLLLQLERHADAMSLLGEALQLIVEITRTRTAYVEVFGVDGQPALSCGHDVGRRTSDAIGASISRDVVMQATAEQRTLAIVSRTGNEVVASLCVPIRAGAVIGIVWLEAERLAFSELDRERARLLAGRLAAVRLDGARRTLEEETHHCVHEALRRCRGNISEAARRLGVSRAFIYSVLKRRRVRVRHP